MAVEAFIPYATGLERLLNGHDGAVARDLARRAIRVESQAKLNFAGSTGARKTTSFGPGPRIQTGRLWSSITWNLGRDSVGLFADVGSNVEYAAYVELGTDRAPPYPYLRPALSAARF